MNKANVIVDNSAVLAMFAELDERRRKQVYRAAMYASSAILIKKTKENLRSVVKRTKTKNRWNGRTLENGMQRYLHKNDKGITVAIAGKDKRIDFRLRFFELGTKDRKTKGHKITGSYWVGSKKRRVWKGKGGYRGRITASHFFKDAKTATESQIFSEMDNRLSTYIQKINAKYAKQ